MKPMSYTNDLTVMKLHMTLMMTLMNTMMKTGKGLHREAADEEKVNDDDHANDTD